MWLSSQADILNQRYENVTGEQIVFDCVRNTRRPITTSKFGPNAQYFVRLVSMYAPHMPFVWIDVAFENDAFRNNMQRLKEQLNLNVIVVKANESVIRNYRCGELPKFGTPEYSEFQYLLKVEPFNQFLKNYGADCWLTDIRCGESNFRRDLSLFSNHDNLLLKVAPFAKQDSQKQDLYESAQSEFNDVCKPRSHLECGLHTS